MTTQLANALNVAAKIFRLVLLLAIGLLALVRTTNAAPPKFAAVAYNAAAAAVRQTYAKDHPPVKFIVEDSQLQSIIVSALLIAHGRLVQTGNYQNVDFDYGIGSIPFFAKEYIPISAHEGATVYMAKMHDDNIFNWEFSNASPETKYELAHPKALLDYDIYIVVYDGTYIVFSTANVTDATGTTNYVAWSCAWKTLQAAMSSLDSNNDYFYYQSLSPH